MLCLQGLNGKFFIVDFIDGNNYRHVTVVPDSWIFQVDDNSSKCWYPKVTGHISSKNFVYIYQIRMKLFVHRSTQLQFNQTLILSVKKMTVNLTHHWEEERETRDRIKDSCHKVMKKALVYMGPPSQKHKWFQQFQLAY